MFDSRPFLYFFIVPHKKIGHNNVGLCFQGFFYQEGKAVFYPSVWHENKSGNISVLDYSCALRTGASYNYLLVNGIRRFTSRELLRLQGFPDTFKIVVSNQDIRRQTGNSVAVPMIREVAKEIDELLKGEQNHAY